MGRRSLFNQMSQDDDLSALTNYDEKSVKPIGDIAESKPVQQESFYSSVQPSAQPFSYTQPVQAPSPAPSYTSAPSSAPLYGGANAQAASPASGFSAQSAERPMVFALRSDPGAYVYEYSDRLELYRYSPFGGMMLCDKKFKKR